MLSKNAVSRVGALRLKPPVRVRTDATLRDVADAMQAANVSAVVVGERGERLVTECDVARAVAAGTPPDAPAAPFVNRVVLAVDGDLSLGDAAGVMVAQGIRHLPVLSDDGGVIGLLGMPELFRALLTEADAPSWLADVEAVLDNEELTVRPPGPGRHEVDHRPWWRRPTRGRVEA